ncbi:Heavy-metal-associated domain protein [Posidoniimonas polymericola]|uniref:Heavy-metal-associated domain protein n=1 Tax=Posidoniimonas polymericola TaxID=2528002 RepID=A0A5C5ZEK8_9BACT|nr:N-acetyltransferase [Posidoniimonas polymericola]TWT85869.1 Heavy-metal-associated domain protein [Posidoniimonas polymericola]
MRAVYDVTGMHCRSCEAKLRESLLASPHVSQAEVSLAKNRVTVDGDTMLSLAELNNQAAEAGDYHLAPADAQEPEPSEPTTGEAADVASDQHSNGMLAEGVEHDPDQSRFVYKTDGRASVLNYERPADGVIDLKHTFVPPADRGEGIGARLAESALNYAQENGLRVKPTCSYVRSYIEENPRFEPLTKSRTEPAHDPHSGQSHDDDAEHREGGHEHKHSGHAHEHHNGGEKGWLATYKPLLLIVSYLVGGTVIAGVAAGAWTAGFLMSVFMGLFFVTFSLFKMLDLRGFAEAYTSYDLVAARWLPYAYVYPFIELGLGVAYLLGMAPVAVNIVTLVVMLVSTAGVVNAVARGRDIQCGCLGTAFDLPMSTLTIVEDATMAVMAAAMLLMRLL